MSDEDHLAVYANEAQAAGKTAPAGENGKVFRP